MKSNSSKTLFLLLAILIIALVPAVMQAQAHFVSNLEPPSEATTSGATVTSSYAVVDTNQTACYDDNGTETACPIAGQAFYGQDAQHTGNVPSYTNNGNGTITDTITGLMWQKSPNTDGDSDIDADDKLSYDAAGTYCQNLTLANYTDWRLPDIKQLYSLIDFSGTDPSGYNGSDTSGLIPFIDTAYFDFAYGDTSAGERIIDSQYASETLYVADNLVFGVNFADGRIKGYDQIMPGPGNVEKTFFVICVRDNASYGVNDFVDNPSASSGQAATITDSATSLMWAQNDSAAGLNWEESL
ncbi:MAG: DUF1566 domain-containing protein, partial [Aquificales bacterium]|nr:DUF1566 domain-containing protein [Aquificales bacterium]